MTVSLANANFASAFSGVSSGFGNFFIGEGEGAVRIDYDINNDSLAQIINRVNDSEANVFMFYDPVGDRLWSEMNLQVRLNSYARVGELGLDIQCQ